MNLLIKNNLTVLHQVELRGCSGTGLIEFTKVLKKSQTTENYISVQNLHQGFHDSNIDVENLSDPVTQRNIKENILSYMFGDMDLHYDPRFIESNPRQISEVEKILYFNIMAEDMLVI